MLTEPVTDGTGGDNDEHREGGRRRRGRRGRGGERGERATTQEGSAAMGTAPLHAANDEAPLHVLSYDTPDRESAASTSERASAPAPVQMSISEPPMQSETGVQAQSAHMPTDHAEVRSKPMGSAHEERLETRHEPNGNRAPAPELPAVSLTLPTGSSLVLVETSHPAPSVEPEGEVAPRPRRVRPARVDVASEPLQLVETRKESPPSQ